MNKSVLILAAGLGTRMRPLTNDKPKPMIEIAGKPIIEYILNMIRDANIDNIVMNIHYKSDVLIDYIKNKDYKIDISDEREELLDSGGGVIKALPMIKNNEFFVINADCIWHGSNPLITMSNAFNNNKMDIMKLLCKSENAIGFDEDNIYNLGSDNQITTGSKYSYSGIALYNKNIFAGYEPVKFSVRDIWKKSFNQHRIYGMEYDGDWLHIGTPEAVNMADNYFTQLQNF